MNRGIHLLLGLAVSIAVTQNPASATSGQSPAVYPLHIASAPQSRGGIIGHVFGASHRPVPDIYVELRDENDTTLTRAKTDASGRFVFQGLPDGRYKVLVLPYGTDYLEQTQEVILQTVSAVPRAAADVPGTGRSGGDIQQVDFTLKLRENADGGPFAVPPSGVIFAQEVPQEARKLYEKGINFLREKKEKEGFDELKKSLEIFPKYFSALDRLGTEYAARGYNEAAAILLTKAVEVNPRSFSSTFGLGLAQYGLGRNSEAIANLQSAVNLYARSVNAQMYLGMALKRAGKLDQAEAAFKRANGLGNGKIPEVHWQTALLYNDQKRYQESANELELFLKSQPDSRDAEKIKQLIKQLREKAGG